MLSMMSKLRALFPVAIVLAAIIAISAQPKAQRANDPAADAVIGFESRFQPVVAENGMVAAQERIAAQVGADILKEGGNAIDAAVAVGFALAVTHPQAGNLGGGGFMLISLAGGKKVAIDYRETAPAAASRDMFLDSNGSVDREKARYSRASAGVPGNAAVLPAWRSTTLNDVAWQGDGPGHRNSARTVSWLVRPSRRLRKRASVSLR